MSSKVLIAYSTRYGLTGEASQAIARTLRDAWSTGARVFAERLR